MAAELKMAAKLIPLNKAIWNFLNLFQIQLIVFSWKYFFSKKMVNFIQNSGNLFFLTKANH
jgi:hypothetical protein